MAKNIFQLKVLVLLLTMLVFYPFLVHSSEPASMAMDELFPSQIDQHVFTDAHTPPRNISRAATFERLKSELIAELDQLSHFLKTDHLEENEEHSPPLNHPDRPDGGCVCTSGHSDPCCSRLNSASATPPATT